MKKVKVLKLNSGVLDHAAVCPEANSFIILKWLIEKAIWREDVK